MNNVFSDGMFDRMSNFPWFAPTPDEMKKEAEEMARPRKVEFQQFYSEIYDLSDDKRKEKYLKDFTDVLTGIKLRTHFVFNREKQFIATPVPKWIIFMEWAVFKLVELEAPVLPTAGTPDLNQTKKPEERKLPDGCDDLT